ncbi:MAG: hypothetical protein ACHQF4_02235 [Sphingobacteriales bacterium]
MKPKYPKFTADELTNLIGQYFIYIKGKYRMTKTPPKKEGDKPTRTKTWDREPEFATISGLALFLGFSSRQIFDDCMRKGKYSDILKRGCLRVEAFYESRLHQHSTSGAIFALKSMGWNEKHESKPIDETTLKTLSIKIIETGPKPANSEKEVIIREPNESSPNNAIQHSNHTNDPMTQ